MSKQQMLKHEARERDKQRRKENRTIRKIVWISVAVALVITAIVVFSVYNHVATALKPYDTQQTQTVEIEIPEGSTMRDVAKILEDNRIIRDATIFNFYIKTKDVGNLQAGYYAFSPSMTLDQIIEVLRGGGSSEHVALNKVTVVEGYTLEQIADEVGQKTPFTREQFLETANNPDFIQRMVATYPELLTSASESTGMRYMLEGYLFPATYDYRASDTIESLIEAMIKKQNDVMAGYYPAIAERGLTVHQALTLASLVEKEALPAEEDAPDDLQYRRRVAGVFYKRVAENMPLQSDISVLYALGTHKELVTYEDLEVDSPYNLYKYTGYGPGPFNSPSANAISATLNPIIGEDLYFLADVSTGVVYFAKTYEEHLELVKQYIPSE